MVWKPDITVAAIIEDNNKFLVVEEQADGSIVFNQPAGHAEQHETLLEGAIRETLEETAYHFQPKALIGVYRWYHRERNTTYLRFAFSGKAVGYDQNRALDEGIIRALWLSADELRQQAHRHRSPLVMRCIEDYLAGKEYSLDLLHHLE